MSFCAHLLPALVQRQIEDGPPLYAAHAARMRAGRVESRPEDYADIAVTEQAKRLREARRAIEERNMMRELGLG